MIFLVYKSLFSKATSWAKSHISALLFAVFGTGGLAVDLYWAVMDYYYANQFYHFGIVIGLTICVIGSLISLLYLHSSISKKMALLEKNRVSECCDEIQTLKRQVQELLVKSNLNEVK